MVNVLQRLINSTFLSKKCNQERETETKELRLPSENAPCCTFTLTLSSLFARMDGGTSFQLMSFWRRWLDFNDAPYWRYKKARYLQNQNTRRETSNEHHQINEAGTIEATNFRTSVFQDFSNGFQWKYFVRKFRMLSATVKFICTLRLVRIQGVSTLSTKCSCTLSEEHSCRICRLRIESSFWSSIIITMSKEWNNQFPKIWLDRDTLKEKHIFDLSMKHVHRLLDLIEHNSGNDDCASLLASNSELISSLQLLAQEMGWVWTHDILICRGLWPFLSSKDQKLSALVIYLVGRVSRSATMMHSSSLLLCSSQHRDHIAGLLERFNSMVMRMNQLQTTTIGVSPIFQEMLVSTVIDLVDLQESRIHISASIDQSLSSKQINDSLLGIVRSNIKSWAKIIEAALTSGALKYSFGEDFISKVKRFCAERNS